MSERSGGAGRWTRGVVNVEFVINAYMPFRERLMLYS